MTGPVTPEQAASMQEALYPIPEIVFETINRVLAGRVHKGRATIYQDEIVELLVEAGMDAGELFSRHWLDIESAYRAKGWDVRYDKPAYCESYRAYWVFQAA
jgi:hypothetical protein